MKRLLLLLLLLYFYTIGKSAQKDVVLYAEIDSLLLKSRYEFLNINLIESIEFASKAFTLSTEIDYVDGEIKSAFYIAQSLTYLGSYDKAFEYLEILNENFKHFKDNYQLRYEIARIRGQLYDYIGLHNESKKEFLKSIEYSKKIKDDFVRNYCRSMAYDNLAVLFEKKNMDSVYYYSQLNMRLLNKLDEKPFFRNRFNLYAILGEYFTHKEQYDSAKYYLNKAVSIADKYEYKYLSSVYYYTGLMELKLDKLDDALISFHMSLDNIKLTNLRNEMPAVLEKMIEVYTKLDNPDSLMIYKEQLRQINTEFSTAKDSSIEKALNILIAEEKRFARKRFMRIFGLVSFVLIVSIILAVYFWLRWRRKRKLWIESKDEVLELKHRINDSFEELVTLLESNSPTFAVRFKELYPEFSENLTNAHPDLTQMEFELCAMMFLNYSSKDIAMFQYVQHRSVQTRKSRLRKKFNLKPAEDLYNYIHNFG